MTVWIFAGRGVKHAYDLRWTDDGWAWEKLSA